MKVRGGSAVFEVGWRAGAANHAGLAPAAMPCLAPRRGRYPTHTSRVTAAPCSCFNLAFDTSVIALWLGHAGVRSTDAHVPADISITEEALTTPAAARPGRYRPPAKVLAFLETL
jgi:hypothetical protein